MGVRRYLRVLVQVWLLSLVEGGGGSHARSSPFKNAGVGVGPRRHVELVVWAWALVIVWSGHRYLRVVWVRVLVVVEAVGGHLCSSPLLHGGGHGCLSVKTIGQVLVIW